MAARSHMAYVVRKLLHSLFLFFGVSILVFALLSLAPGDFFTEMRLNPALTAASVEQMRVQRELDQPLVVRYAHWLKAVARGDWGESLAYQVPVWPLLRVRARNTFLLTVTAAVMSWVVALLFGTLSAMRPAHFFDHVAVVMSSVLLGVPEILIGLLLLLWAVRSHSLPAGGMTSVNHDAMLTTAQVADVARHLVLPATTLALVSLPVLFRHVRSSVGAALASPSIRTARAAGIGDVRVVWRHALPLASNPLISLLGLSIAGLLSGSLLVEWIMSWPGLGPLLLEAIFARDVYVVIGAVMLSTFMLVIGNLFADLLLMASDPRIRELRA
jgi:ABC-type dipeptide/oligopeptide/nickel transport system permease component